MIPSTLRTGFNASLAEEQDQIDDETYSKIKIIMNKYMTNAIDYAVMYCKASGRDTLTSTDIEYALKFQAHEFEITDELIEECEKEFASVKKTCWADVEESDDDECETGSETDDECETGSETDDDEQFERCEGDQVANETIAKMNKYHDDWNEWVPQTDTHKSIKNSIDKVFQKELTP
jgi:hypothetical protein